MRNCRRPWDSRSAGRGLVFVLLIGFAAAAESAPPGTHDEASTAGLRRPVALALTDSGRQLWVANERSGTVSLIDTERLELSGEFPVGERLTDLVVAPDGDRLFALDGRAHQLLALSMASDGAPGLRVMERTPLSAYPVRLALTGDGARCFVTALWSRRLDVLEVSPDGPSRLARSVELPFAPRELVALSRDRVLVADAFGGGLAVVDVEKGELERRLDLPIHNIGGLALSAEGSEVVIAHQSIDPYATTSREDVLWGVLVSNRMLSIRLKAVLSAAGDAHRHSRGLDLGNFTHPAGDPSRVAVTSDGEVAVSLAGTGRVALARMGWPRPDHVRVGHRPTALVASDDGRLFVANTLSDTISVVDVAKRKRLQDVALGPRVPLTEAERGELLFFNAGLSLRGWMSCHSCHTNGHANGTVVDTLGDGGFGAPKRVPSLLGVGESSPWAWNGSVDELEHQVGKSLETTLHTPDATNAQIRALTAFLRTLQPPEMPAGGDDVAQQRGEGVFLRSRCDRCHTPPEFTSLRARYVYLVDEVGNKHFNPPSLRGVRHRSTFLHDGRAASLREVFSVHKHPGMELTPLEIDDLVAFLSGL